MPLTLQRMGEHRLVLAAVLLTILVSASLAAALAVFAGQTVPQAVHRRLALASGTTVLVSGPVTENQETAAVHAALRSAFGTVPFTFYGAMWSDSLDLAVPAGAAQVPLIKAAAADAAQANSVLVSGSWPTPPRPGQPIPAALPAVTASLLRLTAGDVLTLRDRVSGRPVSVRLTGTFRPRDPAAAYWQLNLIGNAGFSPGGRFTTYGPLLVSPGAFGGALAVGSASWLAEPDTSAIGDGDLSALAGQINTEQQLILDSATLGGLKVSTNLPALLDDTASNLVVAHSLLLIGGLQLLLLAATALTLAVRLLASQRQAESALLSARGGARWQLARLNVAEAMPLAVVAVGGGVLAGVQLAGLLARTGPLRTAGLPGSGAAVGAWAAAVVVTLLCVAVMLGSGLRPLSPGAAWTRRGRQVTISGLAQAGGDIALLLLATAAVAELRRYSAVAPSAGGTFGVDPVLAVAPVLALVGGTVVLVRLVPIAARAGDRLASRGRRLAAALAVWQLSRRPVHQAGAAMLVVLAVATGTFALSAHQSWVRSVRDQAAFTAAADVRVDTPLPVSAAQAGAITTAPGVRQAMPVAQLGYGNTGQALAVDATKAAAVTLLRPDLSALPAPALFRRITPAGHPPGLALPGRPARIEVTASLDPASRRLAPAAVFLSVQDADGTVYTLPAGTLSAAGRPHGLVADGRPHGLVADVAPARGAVYPLRLLAVTLAYSLPRAPSGRPAVLTVRGIAASAAASGPLGAPFAPGTALAAWTPAVTSADLAALLQAPGSTTARARLPSTASWRAAGTSQALSFNPGGGPQNAQAGLIPGQLTLTAAMPRVTAIPGLATQAYLGSAGVSVGSIVPITVTGVLVPVKIVAAVGAFPTVSGPGGAVVVDLAAVQDVLAAKSLPPAPVTQWWLATTAPGAPAGLVTQPPPGLLARLPAGSVVTVPGRIAASLLGDPLSAAPQQALLAIAAAAALIAIAGFSVAIAASVGERRSQSALLSALGVSQAAQARQFSLEELMLSLPSAAAGVALGAALAWLLVPAVTLTTGAVAPVPAPLTEFAWSWAVLLAAGVAVLPVLVAAATAAYRPDPAVLLRTTEAA
jgi:ABC-type antimicrobial peptide transport system permease subunit